MSTSLIKEFRLWLDRYQALGRRLLALVTIFVFLFLLWYAGRAFLAGEYDLATLLAQIRWQGFLLIFLLYALALVLAVWVWGSMMGQMAPPVPWVNHWYIYITTGVTRRLPGSLWHVAGRAVLYQPFGIPKRAIAVVSGLEVVLMMISGAFVLLLTWPVIASQLTGFWQAGLILLGLLIAVMTLFHPATWQRLRTLSSHSTADGTPLSPWLVLLWLLTYSLMWVLGGMILLLLAISFQPLSWQGWVGVIGAWALGGLAGLLIMILPSGLGVSELSMVLILSFYMPPPVATLVAIGSRLSITLYELLIALITWLIPLIHRRITRKY
ncbi:MAG: flippase-like domain-containing protein [Ardenticatenales bacterium]|nr:flippase-like domain-containing protein [Ardenticatenales bacterium]